MGLQSRGHYCPRAGAASGRVGLERVAAGPVPSVSRPGRGRARRSGWPGAARGRRSTGHSLLVMGVLAAPPPFGGASIFSRPDLGSWLSLVLVVSAGLYLYGVHRLRARGDHWPISRTLLFIVVGLGSIAFVTMSGIR